MKYIAKCNYCDSVNLKKTEYIQGVGEGFICLDCNNEMSLREITFKESKIKSKKKCTACNGSGWYDSCDKKGSPIPCGGCNGTGKIMT